MKKNIIYADNAATTKLDDEVFCAMKPYLLEEYGNASQPYSFARPAKKALKTARKDIADCIGSKPEEIYFTSGGTESDNWAIKGSVTLNSEKRGIITCEIEHHAILNSCTSIERFNYPLLYLSVDNYGEVSVQHLEKIISKDTKLVSVMMANNEIGTIQPIKELGTLVHRFGAKFHTDAVQALGHVRVNVEELGVDMLSGSAHKFNGPKGIGFLYIKNGIILDAYANGGSQENGMRAGTENIASIVGMAAALKKNCLNLDKNKQHLEMLTYLLLEKLDQSGVIYIRNGIHQLPGLLSLSFPGFNGEALLHRLDLMGVCVSTGSACNSKSTQISHVLKAIKLDHCYAEGTIRISLGYENTISDVTKIANSIIKVTQADCSGY